MKATTKLLADAINQAIGPLFRINPDYKTISQAMSLVIARIAQATPDKGMEHAALGSISLDAYEALTQFLNEEESAYEQHEKTIRKGNETLSEMVERNGLAFINGGGGAEGRDEAEELMEQFSSGFIRPELQGENNVGDHPEALSEYRDGEQRLTTKGFEALKKAVISLHSPNPESPGQGESLQEATKEAP